MIKSESWQRAEIPGPIRSFVIEDPKRIASILKSAKKAIIIIGDSVKNFITDDFDPIKVIIEIAKKINAHINVTGPLIKEFIRTGYKNIYLMTALDIVNRISDPNWMGHDGKGKYDLIVFIGFPYYYEWLLLNSLKHFAYIGIRTLSLDPYYQPNSTFSLSNLDLDKWCEFINGIISYL